MQQTGFLPHFHSGRIEKASGRGWFHLGRIVGVARHWFNTETSFAASTDFLTVQGGWKSMIVSG